MAIKKLSLWVIGLQCLGSLNAMESTNLEFPGKGIGNSVVTLRIITGAPNSSVTDITRLRDVDVIVNASNEICVGGGGINGAVHRAAGKQLAEYIAMNFKADDQGTRCPVGTALATPSFNLQSIGISCIVHAVGPTNNHPQKEHKLRAVYTASLQAANDYAKAHNMSLKNIAFPSISTGIYGYPVEQACHVALDAVIEEINKGNFPFKEVRFVVWPDNYDAYARALQNKKKILMLLKSF